MHVRNMICIQGVLEQMSINKTREFCVQNKAIYLNVSHMTY